MISEIRQNFTEASASVGLILATALPLSKKWASLLMRDSDKRDLTRMVFTLCFGLRWSQMGSGCLIMMVGHTWKIDCITTVDNKIIYLPMSFRHVAR